MKQNICIEIENLINRLYKKQFKVVNYGYYLWVWKKYDNRKIMVIHGHGEMGNPYEILLIGLDEGHTVSKTFKDKKEMKSYLKDNLTDDMIVYGI